MRRVKYSQQYGRRQELPLCLNAATSCGFPELAENRLSPVLEDTKAAAAHHRDIDDGFSSQIDLREYSLRAEG